MVKIISRKPIKKFFVFVENKDRRIQCVIRAETMAEAQERALKAYPGFKIKQTRVAIREQETK